MWVWPLGREGTLEKGMATHYGILAWRIPWAEEPGGLQSMGLQRVKQLKRLSAHACKWLESSKWQGLQPWLCILLYRITENFTTLGFRPGRQWYFPCLEVIQLARDSVVETNRKRLFHLLAQCPCFPLCSPSKKAKSSDVYLLLFYLTLHCFLMDIVSLYRILNLNRVIIPLEVI